MTPTSGRSLTPTSGRSMTPTSEQSMAPTWVQSRRDTTILCKDQPPHLRHRCCLEETEIVFDEMGLDFVLAPRRVKISRCRGRCQGCQTPLRAASPDKFPDLNAILRVLNPGAVLAPDRRHCCAPKSFKKISMLYYDGKSGEIKLSVVPDVIVDSCYCV